MKKVNVLRWSMFGLAAASLIFCISPAWSEPQPGDVIDASNIDQYKDYFPDHMQRFIKDGWGLETPATVHVAAYAANLPPKTFRDASEQNKGKVTLNSDGTLNGYEAGIPFPNPEEPDKALKIMWNMNYHWKADQFFYPDGFWVTNKRKGGSISHSTALIDMLFFTHRTAVAPKPSLNNPDKLYSALMLDSQTPPNKDMVTLAWRYEDPKKADDMWTYIPTLRRTLRLVSSERSNPVRGSPYTWDDFYGFDGKVLEYKPTLVATKPMLGLMNQKTFCVPGTKYEHGYDHPVLAGSTDPYELRDMLVIDVTHINPRNPEQKKTLYIASDIYFPIYSAIYDKQGNLWKGMIMGFAKVETATPGESGPWNSVSSLTDFKTGYWGQNLLYKICADCKMDVGRFHPGALGTF